MKSKNPSLSRIIAVCLAFGLPSADLEAQRKSTRKTVAPSFAMAPFDLNVDKLPAGYLGHNIAALFSLLQRIAPEKREFESTAAVRQRLEVVDKEKLYAFAEDAYKWKNNPECDLHYNADKAAWEVQCNTLALISIDSGQTYLGTYRGSNAFGVSKTIQKVRRVLYWLNNHSKLKKPKSYFLSNDLEFTLPMQPAQAKTARDRMRILYICKLFSPENHPGFAYEREFYFEPRIDDPEEVEGIEKNINVRMISMWVYDKFTGEILLKLDPFDTPVNGPN